MYWFLVMVISGYTTSSPAAIDHVEFTTKEACMNAIVEIKQQNWWRIPDMVCVPK